MAVWCGQKRSANFHKRTRINSDLYNDWLLYKLLVFVAVRQRLH